MKDEAQLCFDARGRGYLGNMVETLLKEACEPANALPGAPDGLLLLQGDILLSEVGGCVHAGQQNGNLILRNQKY